MENSLELLQRLNEDGIDYLWVAYHDYNGRACAKSVPAARFSQVLESGVVFAKANLDFTLEDHMPADGKFLADTGDFLAVPDADSYYHLAYQPQTALVHAFMRNEDGSAFEGCPRSALLSQVTTLAELGLSAKLALEGEFGLYRKTGDGEYAPANHDGMFTVAGLNREAELMHGIMAALAEMDIQVEQLGKEYGPAQYEMTIRYDEALKAVDNYLVSKEAVRALAHKAGYIASYMPKTYAHLPGNGLHVHLSLWDRSGRDNLTGGPSQAQPLSQAGMHFLAGLLHHADALTALGAPTVNSYKRLQPGSWSPAHVAWGLGNRGALVRIPDAGARARIEFRAGDNTCNPYIYLSGLLAAGIDGIQRQLDPGPAVEGDVGSFDAAQMAAQNVRFIPRSLPQALDALEQDAVIMRALGPVIGPEFLKVKRLEMASYDLTVHAWERQTYLEVT